MPPSDPAKPVTVTQLDASLVKALQLSDAASLFLSSARDAGLKVPARFGTETVARLLGLRTNHPAKDDDLELLPSDPVTRAEAAYSVATILRFRGWEQQSVEAAAATFTLPTLGDWQKRVLDTAVRFVGFPYVWGGTSERSEAPFGVKARGGFDCSGFVWRVYKLQSYPGGAALNATIKGRTTYQMSGEVPRVEADRVREAAARRRRLLRLRGAALEARAGRPHGDLPRRGLDRPLLGRRRRGHAADRLVPPDVSPGAAGRSPKPASFPARKPKSPPRQVSPVRGMQQRRLDLRIAESCFGSLGRFTMLQWTPAPLCAHRSPCASCDRHRRRLRRGLHAQPVLVTEPWSTSFRRRGSSPSSRRCARPVSPSRSQRASRLRSRSTRRRR